MKSSPINQRKLKVMSFAAVTLMFLSLGPQIILWYDRGSHWHGTYATLNADEYLYSAYINSLVEGRPRRNDPFTARPDKEKPNLPETAFSIQWVPAYVLAGMSKILRISTATLFIALPLISSLLAAVAVFWLLSCITANDHVAAVGVLLVLIGGTLLAGQGFIGSLLKLDTVAAGLPFLRRYQPAASFYLFFVFCSCVWLGLHGATIRRRLLYSTVSGLILAVLTYSYLYLWTATVSWLACLMIVWFTVRPSTKRHADLGVFGITLGIFALSLVPYAYLLSRRSSSLDQLQTLVSTHGPDLFRIPELAGILLLVVLVAAWRRGRIAKDDPRTIFAVAFAMFPIVVFNQQVVTGKSMQPFHFESFIVNYAVLVGLMITITLLAPSLSRKALSWLAAATLLLGLVEVTFVAAVFHHRDVIKDGMVPAARRLNTLSATEPLDDRKRFVFSPHIEFMQLLPTYAPQPTLLGMGSVDFGAASVQERKGFLFTHLYYSGVTADRLQEFINGVPNQLQLSYYIKYVIFGHERVRPVLSLKFQPISKEEIETEVRGYAAFAESFSYDSARKHELDYAVISAQSNFDFSNLDRWYQRDAGEQVGDFVLYRLQVRP